MIRRSQLPSLIVLCAAIVAGVAVFILVGRMAGALYGGAALVLGLIFHQKLVRGRQPSEQPAEVVGHDVSTMESGDGRAPSRRRLRRPSLPVAGRKRRALEVETARLRADLFERQAGNLELERRLEEQRERTRELQATFAERVDELIAEAENRAAQLDLAVQTHEDRVAAHESALAGARTELAKRELLVTTLRSELEEAQAAARGLADELSRFKAAQREEQARLAWSWRTHVEEISALESLVEAILRAA